MPNNDVTKAERDLAIRTMMGEANGQGDAGLAAVGHVIMNRVQAGKYGGRNVADVVLAPSQFEPWQTRKSELLSYSPSDPKYVRAAAIFDQIVSGEMPDITDGATHFLNARVVRERGNYGGALPKWTSGGGQDIGDHTFYKPDGPVRRQRAAAAEPASASWDDVLGEAAVNGPKGSATAKQTTTPRPTDPTITAVSQGYSPDELWNEIATGAKQNVRAAPAGAPAEPASTAPAPVPAADPAAGDASAAIGRGIINGVPVVGPALLNGLNKGIAGIRSLQSGKPYADELATVQRFGQATAEANPTATTVGELGGGIAALAPIGATAVGARALGLTGENLLARGVAGGISGGVIGAADAGMRGNDVGTAGTIGAVFGGAAPGVGKVVGAGTNALINAVGERVVPVAPGVSGSAGKVLNDLISADGPQAVQNRLMALGSNGMLAEAGPALEGAAAGLIPKPGEAKSILVNAVRERAAGANARLNDDVRGAIGPAEDPARVTAEILALRKARGGVDYPAALQNAPPVDVSGLVGIIDKGLKTAEGGQKTALQTLRARLVKAEGQSAQAGGPTGLLDASGRPIIGAGKPATSAQLQDAAENLHNIKGELDAVINYGAPGLGVEQGAVTRTQGSLKKVRAELNAALEGQVPGYAEANKTSAALAKRAEAVETGTQVLGSGKTTLTPEGLADVMNGMSPGERIALAKGTRGEIERQLGVKVNDLVALKSALQGEGGWNTAKLEQIFGKSGTNRLVEAVGREAAFADTTNKLLQNSQTANRLGGAEFIKDAVGNPVDLKGATVTGLVAAGAKKFALDPVMNLLTRTDNSRRDAEIARVLSSIGPERDRLVAALSGRSGALEKTNKLAEFLASRTNAGTNLLTNAAAQPYARSR
ncbi:cell wall hydrolase [Methylorubrum extorquens]|uniref:Cell wall hydrolase SleB domain-containing protein n=1 Tax=Methylorubrum extorquens (strain ATCC 14718 / DSM 1338 / JCM 2805 / NCIMB 9133 / AM1) TaxID=272630 RepID=C5B183_METEA|nr:cell wall hydrolase [Methylorubrum extorquens]ACS41684.1 Hypothetical protein MexAM1_META1p4005 [Methylorubrum extorquens AM1]MCP1545303.1 hypothetical protein [Methylorubrum extorquens]MCP1587350.1 hypothetical protein [Methylorubrum extorquens]